MWYVAHFLVLAFLPKMAVARANVRDIFCCYKSINLSIHERKNNILTGNEGLTDCAVIAEIWLYNGKISEV